MVSSRRRTSIPAPPQMPELQTQKTEPEGYIEGTYRPVHGPGVVHPYQLQYAQDTRYQYTYSVQPPPLQIPATTFQPRYPPEQLATIPQSPESQKQPPIPASEPAGVIAPDTNPLTPTTPKTPNRPSTNMAIVPPLTDSSQFPLSTYTPNPQSIRGGSWQHGLCSCAEPSICLTGVFCPCIVYGRTQYRLTLRGERRDPTNMLGYTAVNGSCIAFAVLCGFNGILAAIQHTRVRKAFNMHAEAGNVAGDCVKGMCCCCCVVAQDEKEVKFREEQGRKPLGSATRNQGYVPPVGMTFNPPPR